jgi:hypothetical protein
MHAELHSASIDLAKAMHAQLRREATSLSMQLKQRRGLSPLEPSRPPLASLHPFGVQEAPPCGGHRNPQIIWIEWAIVTTLLVE